MWIASLQGLVYGVEKEEQVPFHSLSSIDDAVLVLWALAKGMQRWEDRRRTRCKKSAKGSKRRRCPEEKAGFCPLKILKADDQRSSKG